MMVQTTLSPAHCDFRSDTFTTPTPAMREAAMRASVGDAVYEEDESSKALEAKVAKLAGKEAGVFVPSGTMSNQIGIRLHLHQPPHSVLCDYRSHIYTAEASGLAILSQAMVTPVRPKNGIHLTLEDVQQAVILGDNIHTAPTKVISLENTLAGTILPIEEIQRISEFAREHGISMHLDGARLWNASAATGIPLDEYCQYFDTVSLCLSKGLGAPVGSVLVGTKPLIRKAFWLRKQQGGGTRQSGWLAEAAIVAIDTVWPTMKETHAKVARLAKDLEAIGVHSQLPVQSNFIFLDSSKSGLNMAIFSEEAAKRNLKVWDERLAFHHQTSDEAIAALKDVLSTTVELSKITPAKAAITNGAYRSHKMVEKDE